MKRAIILSAAFVLVAGSFAAGAAADLEVQGKRLVSQRPSFTMNLPTDFRLIHSFSQDNPGESSRTRAYIFVRPKERQAEEMLIVQISDRTNPQAEPMTTPPLKPYTERRMYLKEKMKRGELPLDLLIQLMAWNPDAPSLAPVVQKGIVVPPHWALQGQCLFVQLPEHAVMIRYSRDVNSFGRKVSEKGDLWNRESISGNEKKVYETFRKVFMDMIDSIQIKNP